MRGVVLGGEEYLTVAGQRLFERAHAGFAAHDEGRHHVRKDHHVADGHHGQLAQFAFVAGFFWVVTVFPFTYFRYTEEKGSCANDPDVRA